MCAPNINCDNPCRCVTSWSEGSTLHQGTFQTPLLLFTTKWALESSWVISRRTSWRKTFLQKKWARGSRSSPISGSIPSLMKSQVPSHTGKTLWIMRPSHRKLQVEIFACADAWQPRQHRLSGVFTLLSESLATIFFSVLFEVGHPPLPHWRR